MGMTKDQCYCPRNTPWCSCTFVLEMPNLPIILDNPALGIANLELSIWSTSVSNLQVQYQIGSSSTISCASDTTASFQSCDDLELSHSFDLTEDIEFGDAVVVRVFAENEDCYSPFKGEDGQEYSIDVNVRMTWVLSQDGEFNLGKMQKIAKHDYSNVIERPSQKNLLPEGACVIVYVNVYGYECFM
jgi:hypothetical protein